MVELFLAASATYISCKTNPLQSQARVCLHPTHLATMKVIILCTAVLISSVSAGLLSPAPYAYARPALLARPYAPYAVAKVAAPVEDYDPNPQYSYAYDIQDALTGDSKSQQESRSGDVVQGSYSLVDPDGTRRIVEYTADPQNGFNAVVSRQPLGAVVKAAPIAAIH
ncbi:unnamed protein product [Danaus chrysippus]|uniref:(African queen) hypothetical protein n=1 Tax=Danaus chrysippus TaxID=151541 RepID=A0A8J2QS51_9NEOP|nr:unnamed protein product [Danaus chrysippus]